ncbi:MAG TPA: glutamate racemase [Candidatus Aphodousia faecalis]|jgi:glutamate racemase|uniref:glutamate racemase n=1 Tax=Parasutterella secunda TaxID=626947 RepID=UPI001F8FF3ED|nr:glutamate racemase [Parasutterella secunda]MDM8224912.1 glutamate racemase [Parasutterella secunda]MDM8226621.1 glutamate racemase [Parasutterella secunda]HIR21906.1 glutamate racemase [Candidatus Aphodousia faecalis]
MTEEYAVGFFDSGWGGLSILKTARQTLPHENFIYVADCGFAPYGDRSHDFIVERAQKIADFLFNQKHVKALVIACNTATAEAIDTLRKERPEAVIIGVEPAIKPAVLSSQNKRIGMISTTRTARSARYKNLVERFGQNASIFSCGCPGLMDCVEAGEFDSESTMGLLQRYLEPMIHEHIDSLVLGCTHYPFLLTSIRKIVGPDVQIYEPSLAVSLHLKECLRKIGRLNTQGTGHERFYVSKLNEQRKSVACRLWGQPTPFEELGIN